MKKLIDAAYMLAGVFLCILTAVCLLFSSDKLTYLEYRMLFDVNKVMISYQDREADAMSCKDEDGKAAYEILNDITVNVKAGKTLPASALLCEESGKVICELGREVLSDESAASSVLFHIPFLHRPSNPENCCLLLLNEEGNPWELENIENFSWYGGSREFFWTGLSIFGIIFSVMVLLRGLFLLIKKRHVQDDAWAMAMVVTVVSFAVLSVLASEFNPTIMDENDNIIGGMLQTGTGAVLYRDYVSQHTPFVYWLCSLFSMLGAKAFGQFRLLFELFSAILWGLVFFRHRNRKFARAIVLFAVFFGPVSYMFIAGNAGQIISDNVQAIAMTVLFLEMLAYYEDHLIGPGRSVIISMCIFASVGSAFLAVYEVFACMVAVIAEEICYYRRNPESTSFFVRRYVLLAACVLLPWVAAVVYFAVNGALKDAYDMAFRFNLEVYANYGMPGKNFLEPFYSGIINIINLIRETWADFQIGQAIPARIAESVMILLACLLLIAAVFRRGLIQALGILFFIETQATRQAVKFHSIMLWAVVLIFILTELPGMAAETFREKPVVAKVMPIVYFLVLFSVFGLSYLKLANDVIRYRVIPVPPTEISAVNDTEDGDRIFVDAGALQTDYLFYKKRYPVSRLCWTLPWYYEWYGRETAEALRTEKPKAVIFKMNLNVWGIRGFAKETEEIINRDYERVGALDLYERKD